MELKGPFADPALDRSSTMSPVVNMRQAFDRALWRGKRLIE